MTGPDRHYDAEIQDLLDGRLTASVRGEVESHLEACAECRGRLEVLRWTRQATLQTGMGHDLPEGLAGDVARLLDVEDRKRGGEDAGRRLRPRRTAWAAAAALLALAVGGSWLLLRRPAAADLPSQVASDYGRYRAGELLLELETSRPEDAEAMFRRRSLGFRARVFDLAMMGYRVAGARVHEISGRPSALFVYRGPGGELLLCQMYEGQVAELPAAGAERRLHDGIEFLIYYRGGLTLVFWQEGEVVCVLASDIAAEAVVALAFAKAVKVPG
jgi:anti-sigma factor RsiW